MLNSKQAELIYQKLAEECDQAMALVDTLLEEQASLIKMNTNLLGELSVKKEGMMFDLEKRFRSNLDLAAEAGFTADQTGLIDWIDALGQFKPELPGTFETLKQTLLQAQRLNLTNGELVAQQLDGLKERISILTAASVDAGGQKPSDTYGPKGGLSGGAAGARPRAVIR